MQKFYGVQLCGLSNLLGKMSASIETMRKTQEFYGIRSQTHALDDEMKKKWITGTLTPMYVIAVRTNLKSTQAYLERMIRNLGNDTTADEISSMVQQLTERLEDDLKSELLFHVPQDKAKYFEPTEIVEHDTKPCTLFGTKVDEAFPSASFDIAEAGKCLALDRGTACVMHLARASEVALKVLAEDELGLPHRSDWGKHLADIDKELTARYKVAGSRTPAEEFYSEAAAQLGHIKVTWRNPTMHVDRKYTEDEAETILIAIRSFIKHLSSRLREKA